MDLFRRNLKEFVWVALLAFVGLAVAPTISRAIHLGAGGAPTSASSHHHAMASADAGPIEHQHAQHHHPTAGDVPVSSEDHQHSLDQCGLCIVAAHGFAFASTPFAAAVSGNASEAAIALVLVVPPVRDDWSPASSRGPPSRS